MKPDRLQSMIGIAQKAGKLVSGEFAAEASVKSGEAKLVIVAGDASDNTKRLFYNKCEHYRVPVLERMTKEELGHSIGREYRAVAAVLDEGIADAILKIRKEKSI